MFFSDNQFRRALRSTVALPLVFAPVAASAQSAAVDAALQDALRAAQQQRPDLTRQLQSAARAARTNTLVASNAAAATTAAAGGSGFSLSTLGYAAGGVLAAGAGVAGAVAMGGGDGGGSSGGSSSGGASSSGAPVYTVRTQTLDPATFAADPQYIANDAAAVIGAAEAYAIDGTAGAGQTIAVLDGGVSSLAGADISGKVVGYDYVYGISSTDLFGKAMADLTAAEELVFHAFNSVPRGHVDHGTMVASVAAAGKDSGHMHGIAYDADIYSVRWLNDDGAFGVQLRSYNDVATGVINSGASVFNFSIATPNVYDKAAYDADGSFNIVKQNLSAANIEEMRSLQRMMNSGMVGVFSSANDLFLYDGALHRQHHSIKSDEINAIHGLMPTISSDTPHDLVNHASGLVYDFSDVADKMLVVVNYDGDTVAPMSVKCGSAKAWCVAAPGTDVNVIDNDGNMTPNSGSSFAAPVVSGMVAVIKGLYPFMTNTQIVRLIKETATDLDGDNNPATDVDEVFGHGLVNLAEALQPQGLSVVANFQGVETPLTATAAALGPAFGSAAYAALADTTIAAVDDYGRAFGFKLGAFVETARERYDFDAQFAAFMAEQDETDFAVGGFGFNFASGEWEAGKPAPSTIFALSTEGGYALAASYDAPVSARFGLAAEGASSQTDAAMGDSFASPLFSFAEGGLGFSGQIPLGDNGAAIVFGMAQGENSAPDSDAEAFASLAEYRHPIGEGSSVRVSLGGLVEENTVLGGETAGALAMADGAPTGFAGVSAQFALGEGFSLIGAYHAGVTIAVPGEGSVYATIDPLVSDSFSAGLRFDGDRLWGLASVSQPLRVARGAATLALPSSQNADGSLNYAETEADLFPDAREINLQLSGGTGTAWGSVMVGGGARLNPNHVADAAPEGLLFFKTTASF